MMNIARLNLLKAFDENRLLNEMTHLRRSPPPADTQGHRRPPPEGDSVVLRVFELIVK